MHSRLSYQNWEQFGTYKPGEETWRKMGLKLSVEEAWCEDKGIFVRLRNLDFIPGAMG